MLKTCHVLLLKSACPQLVDSSPMFVQVSVDWKDAAHTCAANPCCASKFSALEGVILCCTVCSTPPLMRFSSSLMRASLLCPPLSVLLLGLIIGRSQCSPHLLLGCDLDTHNGALICSTGRFKIQIWIKFEGVLELPVHQQMVQPLEMFNADFAVKRSADMRGISVSPQQQLYKIR